MSRRRGAAMLLVLLSAVAAMLVFAPSAQAAPAHPLGNFTINHYDGLHFYPDRVEDMAVVDAAEIPTLQAKPSVDTNGDGSASADERSAYASRRCAALAGALQLDVGGSRISMTTARSDFAYHPGAVNLQTSRLVCDLRAPASLTSTHSVRFNDSFNSAGVGWHEVTAVATGVALVNSALPAHSISDTLLHYPNDLLSSPLDVRGAQLSLRPSGASSYSGAFHVSGSNVFARALNGVNNTFNGLVGRHHLTVGVGLLAVLLAILLGAGHALLPGHGKTIMAAYLVGRRGRLRDVVTVGATVTVTHTAGVLVLGLLISLSASFAPTAAEKWLGVTSGLLVSIVGITLLSSAVRQRRRQGAGASGWSRLLTDPNPQPALAAVGGGVVADASSGTVAEHAHSHGHGHAHGHSHEDSDGRSHGHEHSHGPSSGHSHGHSRGHSHGLGHSHSHGSEEGGYSRSGLLGLGIAGGLVPSPSALVVLLGAIALGRTVFGVLLVLAYGLGLTLTLTAAGLLLVPLRQRAERWRHSRRLTRATRLLDALPVLTPLLVVVVGVGLAVRSFTLY